MAKSHLNTKKDYDNIDNIYWVFPIFQEQSYIIYKHYLIINFPGYYILSLFFIYLNLKRHQVFKGTNVQEMK